MDQQVALVTGGSGGIGSAISRRLATEYQLNQIIAEIPVGRLAKPEEIAAGVAFLASSDAAFITGANLDINGGQYM